MKYILLATLLILTSLVYNKEVRAEWKVGSPVVINFGCTDEKSLRQLAQADSQDEKAGNIAYQILSRSGLCGNFRVQGKIVKVKGVVTQVLDKYKDYAGKDTQILKVKLVNPVTKTESKEFFTFIYVSESKKLHKNINGIEI
jgi:hypothetical protein